MDIQQRTVHQDDNKTSQVIAAQAVCIALAYIGLLGRFLAKRLARAGYGTDDWLALLAVFLYTATTVDGFICIWLGAGRHEDTLSDPTAFSKVRILNHLHCQSSYQRVYRRHLHSSSCTVRPSPSSNSQFSSFIDVFFHKPASESYLRRMVVSYYCTQPSSSSSTSSTVDRFRRHGVQIRRGFASIWIRYGSLGVH